MSASQEHWTLHDRRRRPRIPAHWPVYLVRESDSHPLETVTKDLSSEGFSCYVPEPVPPGQFLECALIIPSHAKSADHLCLKGRVQVIRLETVGDLYEIGCRLHDYSIGTLPAKPITIQESLVHSAISRG